MRYLALSLCSIACLFVSAQSLTTLQVEDSVAFYMSPDLVLNTVLATTSYELTEEDKQGLYGYILDQRKEFWTNNPDGANVDVPFILDTKEKLIESCHELIELYLGPGGLHSHDHGHDHSGHSHSLHEHSKGKKGKGKPSNGAVKIPNGPCVNFDFEAGDWSGWQMFTGQVNNVPFGYVNVNPTLSWSLGSAATFDQHYIVTGPGLDPATNAFPLVNPDGGTFSAVVGDFLDDGGQAASCYQEFLVDSNNMAFSYSYSVVMEDPGHSTGAQPFFKINMYDSTNTIIPCGDFEVVAGDGNPAWNTSGIYDYISWQTVYVPLNNYLGQNVRLEFLVGDCDLGAHAGYGYIDASCQLNEITATDTVVCNSTPVTLYAPDGGLGYLWSNGSTADSIVVNAPGLYTVDVASFGGCSLTFSINIYGGTDFPVWFTTLNECDNDTLQFQSPFATDPNNTTIEWDFTNDGIVDYSGLGNPNYVYPDTGLYTVDLHVEDWIGCVGDTTIDVYVKPTPTADFSFISACDGDSVPFTDISVSGQPLVNHNWDFNADGIWDAVTPNTFFTFPSSGDYDVSLQVINAVGCQNTITQSVHVYPLPTPDFTSDTVCFGTSTTFQDLSVANEGTLTAWDWTYNSGTIGNASALTHQFPTDGPLPVNLSVTNSVGCSNDTTLTVFVWALPEASFSTDSLCLGGVNFFTDLSTISSANSPNSIIDWSWTFGGVDVSSLQSPFYTFSNFGSHDVNLVVTSDKGCIDDTTVQVIIHPIPVASFATIDTAGCTEWCPQFTDSSSVATGIIDQYAWDFGDGGTDIVAQPIHCYNNTTLAPEIFDVSLEVTTEFGCTDDTTIQQLVTVWPLPIADFEWNPKVIVEDFTEVLFTDLSDLPVGWSWSMGDGYTDTIQDPSHIYDEQGAYTVELAIVNEWGCLDTVQYELIVLADASVWAPNAFTPDGDGINDAWTPICYGCAEMELLIFNRWGELLIETNQLNWAWDGTYKGKLSQPGVYVYKLTAIDTKNRLHDHIGHISLVR